MSTYDNNRRQSLRQRNTSAMFRAEGGETTENDRAQQRIMEDPPRDWTGSKAGTSTVVLLLVLAIGGVAFFALSGDTTAPSRRLEAEAEDDDMEEGVARREDSIVCYDRTAQLVDWDVHCRTHCFAIHAWQDKVEKRELRENLSHDDPRWTAPRADGRCGPAYGWASCNPDGETPS